VPGSVPTMVRSYKSSVTKLVRDSVGNCAMHVWQSNYFERVLRNGEQFSKASRYILENPSMWHLDIDNPKRP
jgi:putative transposase